MMPSSTDARRPLRRSLKNLGAAIPGSTRRKSSAPMRAATSRFSGRADRPEAAMHKVSIPQSIIDRVIARRGREHVFEDIEPAKTALVVVDMQNAFMLPGIAH